MRYRPGVALDYGPVGIGSGIRPSALPARQPGNIITGPYASLLAASGTSAPPQTSGDTQLTVKLQGNEPQTNSPTRAGFKDFQSAKPGDDGRSDRACRTGRQAFDVPIHDFQPPDTILYASPGAAGLRAPCAARLSPTSGRIPRLSAPEWRIRSCYGRFPDMV